MNKLEKVLTSTAVILALAGLVFMGLSLVPEEANADNGLYGGALIGTTTYEEGSASLDMTATSFILGVQFSDYVGSECRYGSGMNSDSLYGIKMELDNYYGCYVLFTLPVNRYIQPYVIGGYSRAEVTISHPMYGSNTDSGSGSSLGFGIKAELNNHFNLRLERLELIDKDGYTFEQTSLAANWQF